MKQEHKIAPTGKSLVCNLLHSWNTPVPILSVLMRAVRSELQCWHCHFTLLLYSFGKD